MSEDPGLVYQRWHEMAMKQDEPHFKFICEFIGFNVRYKDSYPSYGDHKGAVSMASNLQDKHNELLKSDDEYNKALSYLMKQPTYNVTKKERVTLRDKDIKRITDRNKLSQIIEYIYQLRCNLFHGNKYEFGDKTHRDYLLPKNGYIVLSKLLQWT